LKVFHSQITL